MSIKLEDYPDVLTADQLAEILQMSTAHVYNLAKQGSIPCRKFGKCVRFSKKEIMEIIIIDEENEGKN